ncbi:uncharacterized protein N7483_010290 [Penicillium malachiteum]|uniref:uncharacterized protein n=1 Tax=Penicillium malachiteum TaxID=1324776 RepID=UPI00254714AE|nr:uncharacterized protein N7483_010290 [Penicillium malachiteum]KAJ5713109.1 hypothetical protein N7483_010290 [Penicillium malachiteum]
MNTSVSEHVFTGEIFRGGADIPASSNYRQTQSLRGIHPSPLHDLLEFAEAHIHTIQGYLQRGLSPGEAMSAIGMSEQIQSVLVDPEFEGIRQTEEIQFWLKLAVRTNYEIIRWNRRILKSHAKRRSEPK